MQAQWKDPQYAGKSLAGRTALVACAARDFTLGRICEDRLAADAQAAGLRVIRMEPPTQDGATAPADRGTLAAAARRAGADLLLAAHLERGDAPEIVSSGPSIGVGGGSASGGRGSFGGVGIGVTLPIGGSGPRYALNASTTMTDLAADRLVWSGTATSPGSLGAEQQVGELSRVTFEAIKSAGLL